MLHFTYLPSRCGDPFLSWGFKKFSCLRSNKGNWRSLYSISLTLDAVLLVWSRTSNRELETIKNSINIVFCGWVIPSYYMMLSPGITIGTSLKHRVCFIPSFRAVIGSRLHDWKTGFVVFFRFSTQYLHFLFIREILCSIYQWPVSLVRL